MVRPAFTFLVLAWVSVARADPSEIEFFEKRIRPVLVERCYSCHSQTSEKLKGGLHLDSRAGILRGGESGQPALIPFHPERSRLLEAISYTNEDLRMPPKARLSQEQVADFSRWIAQGAIDPRTNAMVAATGSRTEHWAFRKPGEVQVPRMRRKDWAKNPVDQFIGTRLEQARLQPAKAASARSLIRRAYLDLVGFPPENDEVESFCRNKSAEAYPALIEKLLASPHYGERWGRYWLDVARYADTKGYVYSDREEGRFVHAHVYRDWVVRALNEDMPYDQFLQQQLAADQIPRPHTGKQDLAALGFLTLGRRFLGVVHDIIDDRIDVTMRGMQGLTVGCARCHDHKFDPIPTADYYALYGVFGGSFEKLICLDDKAADDAFVKGLQARQAKLLEVFEKKKAELTERVRKKTPDYLLATLHMEKYPTEEFYSFIAPEDLNPIFVRQWHAYLQKPPPEARRILLLWQACAASPASEIKKCATDLLESSTANRALNPLLLQVFQTNPPSTMLEVAEGYGKIFRLVNQLRTNSASSLSEPEKQFADLLTGEGSPANVPPGAIVDLEWFFDEGTRVELAKLQMEIDRWIIKSGHAPPFTVALEDRPVQPTPRIFKRGNPATRGAEVPKRFLEILGGEDRPVWTHGSGRAELAREITRPDNPLTARVMMNRIWMHHFGSGLVTTPSDFGTRSQAPSHPALLDWLAGEFVRGGWSVKKIHRLIMLSSTYQQESKPSTRAEIVEQIDPENRLLSYFPRERLDFETLRDSLLRVSGELDLQVGGRPGELTPAFHRRTLYGLIDRQFLPGIYRVFDFANPDMHSPGRPETTVPQQALFFLNSPFAAERAKALAARSRLAAGDRMDGVVRLYELALQRKPSRAEIIQARQFLGQIAQQEMPEPAPEPPSPWAYGYGEMDGGKVRFQALPQYVEGAWQGGSAWPDKSLGWLRLTAEGGHAGDDLKHLAIRRWTAPVSGTLSVHGMLRHEHAEGDGIHAWIISSRSGPLGEFNLHHGKVETKIENLEVQEGDTIDFVVGIAKTLNHNEFLWSPVVRVRPDSAREGREWNAKKDFAGPPILKPRPLTPMEQLAQVLLLSNEFIFVD